MSSNQDADDFKIWLKSALGEEPSMSDGDFNTEADKLWNTLSSLQRHALASAMRDVWDARRGVNAADEALRTAATEVSDVTTATAHEAWDKFLHQLEDRRPLLANLSALISKLETSQQPATAGEGDLAISLKQHLQHYTKTSQDGLNANNKWLETCSGFGSKWTRRALDQVKNLAKEVLEALSDTDAAFRPAKGKLKLPPKPARGNDGREEVPQPGGTLQAGAAPPVKGKPKRPSKRARPDDDQEEAAQPAAESPKKVRKDKSPNAQAGAAPSQQPEIPANPLPTIAGTLPNPNNSPPTRFPRPPHGEEGAHARWLFDEEMNFSDAFRRYCMGELAHAQALGAYNTMDDLEPLARILELLHTCVLPDHDWENEAGIQRDPLPGDNYLIDVRPNVRRVLQMVKADGTASLDSFVSRHLSDGSGVLLDNADDIARELIKLVKERGRAHDWDNEPDITTIPPPPADDLAREPLLGLDSRYDGRWSYLGVIGQGGNGRAVLYVQYNTAGRIINRLVVKEVFLGRQWNNADEWYGPFENRVPIEAAMHRVLPNHKHIVEFLGFSVFSGMKFIRHYTAFAELEDLHSLWNKHLGLQYYGFDQQDRRIIADIPTVAIAYFFEAMAAGACLMAHGALPDDRGNWPNGGGNGEAPEPAWRHSIVHQDIKLGNYFLANPTDSTVWPGLPVVKLGDFGNSLDRGDPYFAAVLLMPQEMGTDNWMAPEQIDVGQESNLVWSATNVYQVGLTILHLMSLTKASHQPSIATPETLLFTNLTYQQVYPPELVVLAESCCTRVPALRPSAKKVYMDIRKIAMAYPAGDHGVPLQFQRIPSDRILLTPADKYAVWAA